MILTKTEMEDIWYNKPVGYFSDLKKKLKKTKLYKVHLTPIKYNMGETEAFEVRASSRDMAILEGKEQYYNKHGRSGPDAWRTNVFEK